MDSRSEYAVRMHRVQEYIDQHLDEPLELATLAGVAHFSSFHFHRLFAAWMGETFGEYLRRRRLEQAALRLVAQPRLSILDVALAVGFGSAEAFTRAFKARFGLSASAWRRRECEQHAKNSNPDQVNSNLSQATYRLHTHDEAQANEIEEFIMKVTLVDRHPTSIAYLRHVGPYGDPIGRFWQQQVYPWMITNKLLGAPRYGISHDDPNIAVPNQLRYDAGVEVSSEFEVSGPAFKTKLPGGKYASAEFQGTSRQIADSWKTMLRDWLPSSGMQLDSRPLFEYYPPDSSYDPATGVFECQICIPVTPL
jgi:AraC family transcriptional regulator